ncbi:hypothetical protein L1785_14075 [Antribacter sp. KLBMP9083]|uniref:Uncharacterized protein n=1 Tax=Antribacter soli TaxID=2910976 RepID=A0AA41QG08_9MICO|nr:hypothetical protein [Antribacter soli]MCF4122105.1 hypothetical protein [Antribacter soli]
MDTNENGDPGVQGQDVPGQDEAFERLAAADPAAGAADPVPAVLRAKVDAQLADDGAAGKSAAGKSDAGKSDAGTPVPGDELAARRARRRTGWLGAAAAVALVAVGGGGYLAGAAGAGPAGVSDNTAEAPITLEAPAGSEDAGGGAPAVGAAPETLTTRAAGGAGDSAASYPYGFWGRTVFHAGAGLSTSGSEAEAFGLDPAGIWSADTARRVAEAFGVSGEPRLEGGYSWVVGPPDGSGPSIHVYADGTGSADFYDPSGDPWSCPDFPGKAEPGSSGEGGTEEGTLDDDAELLPAPDCPTLTTPGAAPSADDAVAALRDVMSRIGVDLANFELEAGESYEGEPWRYATAWHVVGGQRTGLTWSASVSASGIANVYGFLAETISLGQYPVVSEAEAVERLGDPRFGASGGVIPLAETAAAAAEGDVATSPVVPAPDPTVPPTPTPGDAIAWPVSEVTITSARLGLAQQYQPDGAVLLLPAYELRDADGNTWSVLAVAEDALDFTP